MFGPNKESNGVDPVSFSKAQIFPKLGLAVMPWAVLLVIVHEIIRFEIFTNNNMLRKKNYFKPQYFI